MLFEYLDINDGSWETTESWVKASSFYRDAIAVGDVCEPYADDKGWLPRGVPLEALEAFSWR